MDQKKSTKVLIRLILGLCAGALLGFAVGKVGHYLFPDTLLKQLFRSPAGPIETAAKLILALVGMWAALATHELGHLLTGLVQGFRFHMYVAGFLGIRRNMQTDAVEVYLNRDPQLFGGIAATIPIQRTDTLRQQFASVVIAGPLASLMTGILALLLTYYGINHLTPEAAAAYRCLLVFGLSFSLISLMLFLATTIPTHTGAFFTDRARFFRLIRGGRNAEVEQAVLETLAHSMSGQLYGQLDYSQLQLLLEEPKAFFRSYAHSLTYYYHLDRNELVEAYGHIKQASELLDGQAVLFKNEIWKELAFAHAYIGHDASLAKQVWAKISPPPDEKPNTQAYLVKAAVANTDGQQEEARQLAQRGLALLPNPRIKAEHKLYGRLLEQFAPSRAFLSGD